MCGGSTQTQDSDAAEIAPLDNGVGEMRGADHYRVNRDTVNISGQKRTRKRADDSGSDIWGGDMFMPAYNFVAS